MARLTQLVVRRTQIVDFAILPAGIKGSMPNTDRCRVRTLPLEPARGPISRSTGPRDTPHTTFGSMCHPIGNYGPERPGHEAQSLGGTSARFRRRIESRPLAPLGPPAPADPSPPAHRCAAQARAPGRLTRRVEWRITRLGGPSQSCAAGKWSGPQPAPARPLAESLQGTGAAERVPSSPAQGPCRSGP